MDDGILDILVFLGAGGGFAAYWYYTMKRQREAWVKAADMLDLDCSTGHVFGHPELSGRHRGRKVRAWVRKERRGGSKNRRTIYYTVVTTRLNAPCWRGFTITEHGITDSIAKFFGGEDREVGDEDIDSKFRIKGEIDERARECLRSPEVQDQLKRLMTSFGEFKLEDGTLRIECKKRITLPGSLTRRISRVVDAAGTMDRAAGVGGKESREDQWAGESTDEFTQSGGGALFPDPDDAAEQEESRKETSEVVW